jgi:hypothetical protein
MNREDDVTAEELGPLATRAVDELIADVSIFTRKACQKSWFRKVDSGRREADLVMSSATSAEAPVSPAHAALSSVRWNRDH